MRALIQRIQQASVCVHQQLISQINHGLLVFIGIAETDDIDIAKQMIDKLLNYRVFNDADKKMSLNVQQVGGSILLVSQFTLMAQTHKGLRPDFSQAMTSAKAKVLFTQLVAYAKEQYALIATGQFGADMQVNLTNDGPVTLMLDIH